MQTLDIECPSCSEMLELDAGFAGGVCRCSNCGTLMTVPSDAGKAESLMQPTSNASVGSGGMSSVGVSGRSTRGRSGAKRGKAGGKRRTSSTIEAGEYRTASGKVIKVEKATRVPMAEGRRKKVRAATAAVFFSVIAVVVVGAVIGIIAIMGGPSGAGDGGDGKGAVVFDQSGNPYTLDKANVMGILLSGRTVVVVEASEYSAEWAEAAADMLGAGLSQASDDAEVALIGAGESPVLFAGGSPRKVPINAKQVREWFAELPAEGEGDVAAAITKALDLQPQTLIVVHGYTEMSSIEAWNALVKDTEGLKVHTVHIGSSSPELEGFAGEYGGVGAVWSVDEIEALKELAAENAGG